MHLSGHTKPFAVLGHPIGHTLSPVMHNASMQALGFDMVWFGIVVIVPDETALITPPVGLNLFVVHNLRAQGSMNDVIVGALPFVAKGPAISEPIWKSRMPVRTLEPYHATFHYAEAARGATPPKPRTMKQAVDICSKARPR